MKQREKLTMTNDTCGRDGREKQKKERQRGQNNRREREREREIERELWETNTSSRLFMQKAPESSDILENLDKLRLLL